ncbi:electron transfer flavoprotein subunit beta/FixA family protein [Ferrimonas pelagia]|uniref:Electron transfer flavoprotein subunit beta/FixA family protein n=1 Tax=Ferrimonas pelagia TaxID=1177826 RepID=A0ABP9EED2_9GAMM
MKVLVAIKPTAEKFALDVLTGEQPADVKIDKWQLDPFSEVALAQALCLKREGQVSELIALTVATDGAESALRHALALGADRAIQIDSSLREPLSIATLLHAKCEQEGISLALFGKQSSDGDHHQIAQMTAGLWRVGHVANAQSLSRDDTGLCLSQTLGQEQQTVRLALPAVVSCDLRLAEPGFATLPNIMKARRRPIECLPASALAPLAPERTRVLARRSSMAARGGQSVGCVAELVQKLKHEAKVVS